MHGGLGEVVGLIGKASQESTKNATLKFFVVWNTLDSALLNI